MRTIISRSASRTKHFAAELLKQGVRIFALSGDLGSGKTTFAQGLARALGIRRRITSPTFIIINKHRISTKSAIILPRSYHRFTNFYHIDLYRIYFSRELKSLGLAEILRNPRNVVVIEWAEKAGGIIPKSALHIKFSYRRTLNERIVAIK